MPEKHRIEIPLELNKITHGTFVFVNNDAGMRGVYIPKAYFVGHEPRDFEVRLTIEKKGNSA